MRRRAVAALAVLAGAAALPAAAGAHGESSPLIRGVVDRVEPRVPGVNLVPVSGTASLLRVVNTTPQELEVLSPAGDPFLRVGPRGAYGNLASPYWHRTGNPDGAPGPGAPRRTGARPRWELVSREPAWEYYEHRLHPGQVRLPPEASGTREVLRLFGFSVGLRHGGRPLRLDGHLEFRPLLGLVRPALASGPQPLPGVTAAVLEGRFPGLLLQSTGREPVVVEGRGGEPFARLGPRGAEVNLRSPTYADDRLGRGRQVRVAADAEAEPRWLRISATPSLAWLESRARYAPGQPSDEVARRESATVLQRWSVPLRSGARRGALEGTTSWVPSGPDGLPLTPASRRAEGGGGSAAWIAAGGALAVALLAAAWWLRSRRRGAARPPRPSPR